MSDGRTNGGRRSLTGVWQGIYSYPGSVPTVPFTATLIEAGASLSGSVHEPCLLMGSPNETLFASLSGSRHGAAVNFVKTYDGANRHYGRPVVYDGAVNGDATEIEGRWSIAASWSGRFLMTRAGDQPKAAVESEGAETGEETKELTPAR